MSEPAVSQHQMSIQDEYLLDFSFADSVFSFKTYLAIPQLNPNFVLY